MNKYSIDTLINTLVNYGIKNHLMEESDKIYVINRILNFLHLSEYNEMGIAEIPFNELLDLFIEFAVENKLIEDTQNEKDQFDTELMNLLIDRPSNVINNFNNYLNKSSKKATDYFYNLSVKSNYVRSDRIKKDLRWTTNTKYGDLDISINLSKPEKDSRDIAKALLVKSSSYPKCLLCNTNEGYAGRANHPARANIRLIPLKLNGRDFYMQYSPYAYYNEHCIVLDKEHIPMRINEDSFRELLDFIKLFPHYMIGSNADLPIVGGSILTHHHFQGGDYEFPAFRATKLYSIKTNNVELSILNWPLSVIKVEALESEDLIKMDVRILNHWINYNNPGLDIQAFTDSTRHNTITPIFRMENGRYCSYLILRNNVVNDEFPSGIYHPHEEYHHIKKENIGLIEAIGLAILPSRLKKDLNLMVDVIENKKDYHHMPELASHAHWLDELVIDSNLSIEDNIKRHIGETFALILENCGVFKLNEVGLEEFKKFVNNLANN